MTAREDMKSLKLPTAKCKMICDEVIGERWCFLMQPQQDHTQYICAAGVVGARYLYLSHSYTIYESALSVCLYWCVLDALYPAFTLSVPNMP